MGEHSFDHDLRAALEHARQERARLLALVAALSAESLDRAQAGGWSARQVLAHLIESEAVYGKLLAHQRGRAAVECDTSQPATAGEATSRLATTRAAVLELIRDIDAATLYRLVRFGHEEYSPLSVLQNIASHDADHYAQLATIARQLRPQRPAAPDFAASSVEVRAARIDDLPRLTEIYNHYVLHTPVTFDLEPLTVQQRAEWFSRYSDSGRHRLLVADCDGTVAGYTSTSRFRSRRAYETTVEMTVICAPESVGRGIGQRLYDSIFDAIAEEDVHIAVAAITLPNEASCALHERFGFERAAVLPEVGRKFGRYWDVGWYVRRMA